MPRPVLSIALLGALALHASAQTLQEELDERRAGFIERADPQLLESQSKALRDLEESGIYDRVLTVGDKAPDFELTNHLGEPVKLSELLATGPVVLTWYRGGWCPYCNIALAALAAEQQAIEELGASLVALTPERPDFTSKSVSENDLGFEVLTDSNHQVAESYGLVFELNPDTAARYNSKFKIAERAGEEAADRLPLPATYVIDSSGVIAWAFADADYTRRAEPGRIIDALKALRDGPTPTHLVLQFWENVWAPPYDIDLIDRLMTEDFRITSAGRDIRGREAFKAWVSDFHEKAPGIRLENQEIFESGNGSRVVSRWIARGSNGGLLGTEADGQAIEFTGIAIWEVKDGRLAHNWVERSAWELHQRLTAPSHREGGRD